MLENAIFVFYFFAVYFILFYFIFHDNSSFLPFKMSKQQLSRITGILEEEGGFFCIGIKKTGGGREGGGAISSSIGHTSWI